MEIILVRGLRGFDYMWGYSCLASCQDPYSGIFPDAVDLYISPRLSARIVLPCCDEFTAFAWYFVVRGWNIGARCYKHVRYRSFVAYPGVLGVVNPISIFLENPWTYSLFFYKHLTQTRSGWFRWPWVFGYCSLLPLIKEDWQGFFWKISPNSSWSKRGTK